MKRNLKSNKGITLIALVITIIVLLILAGVAISMLTGDNGILRQAAEAKTKTKEGEKNESVTLDTYEDIINGALEGILVVTTPPTKAVTMKTKYKDTSSKTKTQTAVIPKGFKVSENTNEQNIDTGLVVIAPDGSEFVWIPVDDINSMAMCQGSTGINDCKLEKENEKIVCKTHNMSLCGKLYATTHGENFKSTLETQIYNANTGLREPAILTSTTSGDAVPETTDEKKGIGLLRSIVKLEGETDNEILEKWEKQLQDEFDEMIKNVEENKGFYVGRYECSLREENGEKIIQSVKNVTAASTQAVSCNTWYGLYQENKDYSKKNKITDVVGSSMIWGSQYDQMMIWMKNNGYIVESKNSDDLKGATKNTTQTTGKEDDPDILNNVYDLLGGNYEYTLEAHDRDVRICRRRFYNSRRLFTELQTLLATDIHMLHALDRHLG